MSDIPTVAQVRAFYKRLRDCVETAAQKCNFEVTGWIREGKVLEAVSFDSEPDMELEILLIDGFVVIPHQYAPELVKEVKDRAENFANHLRRISGKKVVVEMK